MHDMPWGMLETIVRDKNLDQQIESVAALGDPTRRELYLYVQRQDHEVGRDEASKAVHVSRTLASFHLDKLAEAGLLEVSYRRLTGRTGPGAGRTSKLYRRSGKEIEIALPARRYELVARLLMEAMEEGGSEEALERAAESWGRRLGREARERSKNPMRSALEALGQAGFEPSRSKDGAIVLRNCPFNALRSRSSKMVCRMNLALCRGLLSGLEAPTWSVRLEPEPGRCCAVFQTA
jgi:predicted ArsR family transcriptional regulator